MRRKIVLLLVCAACAGADGNVWTPGGSVPDPFDVPSDPCALLTVQEVEAVGGGPVIRTGLVPDERMHDPAGPNPCEYVTGGRHESILVFVEPHGAGAFDEWREGDQRNTVMIDGVGDEAFAHALASLYVRVGDTYFVLSTQHGAGRTGIRDLKRLALEALDGA
jgi:hypothetical protein